MHKIKYRFVLMILIGMFVTLLLKLFIYNQPVDNNHNIIYDFLVSISCTITVWEGNLRIDSWMNKHYPWITDTRRRILIHFPVIILYSAISIFIIASIYNQILCKNDDRHKMLMYNSLLIGLLVACFITTIEISTQFFKGWKNSLIEVEKYKTLSTQAQLDNLKSQVNPHFLFNNLSVLSSLVYKDQDKAVDFINQLSKVYRYVLDSRNNELVRLSEELTFIESYIYLLKIRFEDNIQFTFDINETKTKLMIPPMCLQIVIENTIKHNEVSEAAPLHVIVSTQDDYLSVKNNLQLRSHTEQSAQTGLNNIQKRYAYFTQQTVGIKQDATTFTVTLPLLNTTL